MTKNRPSGPTLWVTVLYCLFTVLYTIYITGHSSLFGTAKGHSWWYYIKFLLIGSYGFFILQGLLHRSKNWGVLLLLPLALLIASIVAGYICLWIIRWGGGTLLNYDQADMILVSLLFLVLSFFAIRLIDPARKGRRR